MDAAFWHARWQNGQIAFHEGEANAHLTQHWPKLDMGPRVFVPLCGKTEDLAWLAAQGHDVVGAELDARAVAAFFAEHDLAPKVSRHGALTLYSAGRISIWQGDIFALTPEALGPVDAVFDRAALVALPYKMRITYAQHCTKLGKTAPQLLITYEYVNPEMQGPPHSVPEDEVHEHYAASFTVTLLERTEITGPLRKRTHGTEAVYHLTAR